MPRTPIYLIDVAFQAVPLQLTPLYLVDAAFYTIPLQLTPLYFADAAFQAVPLQLALHLGSDVIKPANVVRDLSVILDQELSMKHHINKVTSNCFFQIRWLKQVRCILCPKITTSLITAFVTSHQAIVTLCLPVCQSWQLPWVNGSRMPQPVLERESASAITWPILFKNSVFWCIKCIAGAAHPATWWLQQLICCLVKQPTLRSPTNDTKVWWKSLLVHRTVCLELSTLWSPKPIG